MKSAVTSTYLECEQMLFKLAHKFARVYGLPFEDLMAEARYIFMRAYSNWDPKKGASFSTYLYFITTKRLISYATAEMPHFTRPPLELNEETLGSESPDLAARSDLLRELPLDAAIVARSLIDLPWEFTMLLRIHKPDSRQTYLDVLREYLVTDCGWTKDRVDEVFEVLRDFFSAAGKEDTPKKPIRPRRLPTRAEIKEAMEATWLLRKIGITPNEIRAVVG